MKNLKFHISFWVTSYIFHCIGHFSFSPTKIYSVSLIIILYNLVIEACIFYITLKVLIPFFLEKEQYLKFTFFTILSIFIIVLIDIYISHHLPVPEGDITGSFTLLHEIGSIILSTMEVFPFVFVFWYVKKVVLQENRRKYIEQENHRLEQSIIDTEFNNLKNQINPDFLFRKLDYFYEQSLPHSPSLSKGISLLTEMMKYAINDKEDEGKVSLKKEIKHIQNFIDINQLRFDGRLQVNFDIVGLDDSQQIMPLILITFVENAFKYGELFDKNNPLKITLKVDGNDLFFTTHNRTRRGPKEESEGIGIDNTQKRLSLGYADNYSLDIKQEFEYYEVALYIKLE